MSTIGKRLTVEQYDLWIVNLIDRRLEVYARPTEGAYPAPTSFGEGESVELVIEGRVVGKIAVADLLLQAKGDEP